ncbi:hypothetical protein MLD38_030852 [Melastoma candidum]|uniref:Uncharacterized protein n=1 Tax=Melastoma candidum TaxID=119954 RepID=A0ACB9MMD9_9MYRT|nr:hypothetical protein MLD38_030852 [Melastoma candidum]
MSDFFSLQGGGGGGGFDEQQLGLGDQRSYPVTNPSGAYSAAAVPLPWFYHPGVHQEDQQFFRNQHILQQQDLYTGAAAASSPDLSGLRGGVGVGVGLGIGGDVGGSVRGGFGARSCQDCGNHAKKDCAHLRCRTCCTGRGFDCLTHVKSTWVPAAKRRERQQQYCGRERQQQLTDLKRRKHASRGESMEEKALIGKQCQRDNEDLPGDATMACMRMAGSNTSTGFEGRKFPAELSTSAVFTCVRVSSADDPIDQLAYQTAVSIGGHVFKGILYDHGSETTYFNADAVTAVGGVGGDPTSSGGVVQPPNLITGSSMVAGAGTSRNVATFIDPSLYAAAASSSAMDAYTGITQFFLQER